MASALSSASTPPGRSENLLAEDLKRISRTARDALRAVRDLEQELEGDVHGQFLIEGDEEAEDYRDELMEYIHLARNTYPGRDLTILVVAHID